MKKSYGLLCALLAMVCGCPGVTPVIPLTGRFVPGMNVLSDENREQLINRGGGAAVIDEGDSIRGIITMNVLTNADGTVLLGGATPNAELTAIFQLLVLEKTETAIAGTFDFVFGPDQTFATEFSVPEGTIILGYADHDNNIDLDAATTAAAEAGATDGELFMVLGFTGPDGAPGPGEGWIARGADDGSLPINPGEVVGTANFAVSRMNNDGIAGSFDLVPQTSLFFGEGAEFIGGSAARGTTGLTTPWNFSSDTTITFVAADDSGDDNGSDGDNGDANGDDNGGGAG